MKETQFELFKPCELKIEFERPRMPLINKARARLGVNARAADLPPTQASINAKKALKCDLIATLLAKSGVDDAEFLKTIKEILKI